MWFPSGVKSTGIAVCAGSCLALLSLCRWNVSSRALSYWYAIVGEQLKHLFSTAASQFCGCQFLGFDLSSLSSPSPLITWVVISLRFHSHFPTCVYVCSPLIEIHWGKPWTRARYLPSRNANIPRLGLLLCKGWPFSLQWVVFVG